MKRYGNYMISLAIVLQLIFLTASVARFHQRFLVAIRLPESTAPAEDFIDSDVAFICIDARQNTYVSFSSKKDMQAVAKQYSTCYNNSTVRMDTHVELSDLLRELSEKSPRTRIVVAANKTLPAHAIKQLFSTLRDVTYNKFRLLTSW